MGSTKTKKNGNFFVKIQMNVNFSFQFVKKITTVTHYNYNFI